MSITLHCGDYRETLADVACDALICDPPYSARTHGAYREMADVGRHAIAYASWGADDVKAFVDLFAPRCRGWFCALTDHRLAPAWEAAFDSAGLYSFAPLACMEPGSRVRLSGDGPAQWSVWLMVARPKTREAQQWGALPGGYVVPSDEGWRGSTGGRAKIVTGGKPLWLMRQIVRDYSRHGDVVCDPCAGGATTLIAAVIEGRRAIGSELDPVTHAKALNRIATSGEIERYAPSDALKHAKQARLF